MAKVWIVSLEWNFPPSEVTGDPGIVGVFSTQALADGCAEAERQQYHTQGERVYQYPPDTDRDDAEWDIDVHVTEHTVQGAEAELAPDPAGRASHADTRRHEAVTGERGEGRW